MKIYRCDYCKLISEQEHPIKLEGYTGTSGGILLPERFSKLSFCCKECLEIWADKYIPKRKAQ